MSDGEDAARDARIAQALAPYLAGTSTSGGILLAVSGGPDSTALLHAAARARGSAPIAVATVDHGLRPEAHAEATAVAVLAARLGLAHRVLVWEAPERRGVQARARAARYRLLAAHAAAIGARWVLTGHTGDDQAETVLMRLLSGSGPAGLSGMARERPLGEGVRLARPFLDLPKADLCAYCAAHGLPVVSDPSNADARFARTRLRALLPALEAEGLSAARLRRLAGRLARDEAALRRGADAALAGASLPSDDGYLALDGKKLADAPEAIVLRMFDRAIEAVVRSTEMTVPRRLERLERLVLDALMPALTRGEPLRRTLRGALIEADRNGLVRIGAAPSRRGPFTKPCKSVGGSRVAGPCDLLGKGGGAAYIGPECPEPDLAGSPSLAAPVPGGGGS